MFIAFFRTIVLYVLVIACLRFTGKRQIGELQPSELVTTILISNIAAIPIENSKKSLMTGIIPIILIVCLEIISSFICMKSRIVSEFISGKSRSIIHNGVIDQQLMKNMRITIDDLTEQLRTMGIFNIDEVFEAVIETNGKMSVLPKFKYRSVINEDAEIKSKSCESPSVVVICDGEIKEEGLKYCNMTREILKGKLSDRKLTQKDIFLMTCNFDWDCFIVEKREN